MKRTMISILILTVLGFWIPCASAEISQELDPMVSPDAQATVTSDGSANNVAAGQTSNAMIPVAATKEEKKAGTTKTKKSKKSSAKKSSSKKSSKPSAKKTQKTKKTKKTEENKDTGN